MVSKKHFHKPQAIVCKAAVANLRFVQENISKYLENVHCLPSTLLNIEMILEELFVNIVILGLSVTAHIELADE